MPGVNLPKKNGSEFGNSLNTGVISLLSAPLPVPPQLRHSHAVGIAGNVPFNACLAKLFSCALVALAALILIVFAMSLTCAKILLAGYAVVRCHASVTISIMISQANFVPRIYTSLRKYPNFPRNGRK